MEPMIIGVDIGGSKTLIARFRVEPKTAPQLETKQRFATDHDFAAQYHKMSKAIHQLNGTDYPRMIVVGSRGEVHADGRLSDKKILGWLDVPLGQQLNHEFNCPVELFSDAALATLAEARLGAGREFSRVFYCTISSGIGTGLAINGQLVLDRSGGGDIVVGTERLDDQSRGHTLERLVSGTAIKQHFGQTGRDIKDPATWQQIAEELALALNDFIVLTQPDVVVIGGGIGRHFDQYQAPLRQALERYGTSQYPVPQLKQAHFVEEAVAYGAALKAQELIG